MKPLTAEDIRGLCRDIPDRKVVEMLETGATVRDLEVALAWQAGESDVMGEQREPLCGASAQLYDILTVVEDLFEEEDDRALP